jgi:hypothetical protein
MVFSPWKWLHIAIKHGCIALGTFGFLKANVLLINHLGKMIVLPWGIVWPQNVWGTFVSHGFSLL